MRALYCEDFSSASRCVHCYMGQVQVPRECQGDAAAAAKKQRRGATASSEKSAGAVLHVKLGDGEHGF